MSRSQAWWTAATLLYACTNEMRFAAIESESSIVAGGGVGASAGSSPIDAGQAGLATAGVGAGAGPAAGVGGADNASGAAGAGAGTAEIPQPIGPTGPFVLTLSQECDGELGPDWITKWVPEPDAPTDRTIGHTSEYVSDANVSVVGGLCIIVAEHVASPPEFERPYTSGTINTADHFVQGLGYFEARFKSVSGQGVWADWRLRTTSGWPPAIDVAGVYGRDPTTDVMANYWGAKYPNHSSFIRDYMSGHDFSTSYHVFGVERTATEVVWYVDGVERARTTDGADQQDPRFLSLAILVGKTGAQPEAAPADNSIFPMEMAIDWVRAWQRE